MPDSELGNGRSPSGETQIHRALGRIEGKLDGVLAEQQRQNHSTAELATKHEALVLRVNMTENTLGKILGWAAGVGVTGGVTGAGAFAALTRLFGG